MSWVTHQCVAHSIFLAEVELSARDVKACLNSNKFSPSSEFLHINLVLSV